MKEFIDAEWGRLLLDAVQKPGTISTAYRRFWNYSVGNQLLALFECYQRHLEPGPINTLLRWNELGRHVKRGEKGITLCMPVTVKRRLKPDEIPDEGAAGQAAPPATYTRFIYRARWFLLSQTEGKEYVPAELPSWSEVLALRTLAIERVPFQHLNGNAQGYAVNRSVAVSPIAAMPEKTLFHELAHVVLGHCEELKRMDDDDHTPVSIREVEAECVSLICCESLNLSGTEFCRGYIQHWLGGQTIPERSAQKIFKAADQILKAGHPSITSDTQPGS
jgi:antirestriction protein ArdC